MCVYLGIYCSLGQHICFYVSTMLFWLPWPCSMSWSQILWRLELYYFRKICFGDSWSYFHVNFRIVFFLDLWRMTFGVLMKIVHWVCKSLWAVWTFFMCLLACLQYWGLNLGPCAYTQMFTTEWHHQLCMDILIILILPVNHEHGSSSQIFISSVSFISVL